MSSKHIIPHPNIPTTDIGIAKLKESTMLNNENFLALENAVKENSDNIDNLNSTKAEVDHNHDDSYSELGHTHSIQEVESLDGVLANKANAVHDHPQYLTEMPVHVHAKKDVNGLVDELNGKAEMYHRHQMGDVSNLVAELGNKATQAQFIQLWSVLPSAAIGTEDPKDVVKSSGSASKGNSLHYARYDHVHKMPELKQSDIEDLADDLSDINSDIDDLNSDIDDLNSEIDGLSSTVNTVQTNLATVSSTVNNMAGDVNTLKNTDMPSVKQRLGVVEADVLTLDDDVTDHEERISELESAEPPESPVNSVNGMTGSVVVDVPSVISNTGNANKLKVLYGNITDGGKIPTSSLTANIEGHSNKCFLIADESTVTHSENRMFNLVYAASSDNSVTNLLTNVNAGGSSIKLNADNDLEVTAGDGIMVDEYGVNVLAGNGIDVDGSGVSVLSGDGITVDENGVSVKVKSSSGLTLDSNGLGLTALTANKWVKTNDNGIITATNDTPIVASTTATGVVFNTNGAISYKSLNVANGIAGLNSSSKIGIGNLPTGTTNSTVAFGNHGHGSITSDGRLSNCSSADCFLITSANGIITHTDTDPRVSEVKELVTQWNEADKKLGKVISVCGKTGVVSLDASDVGAADADHTHGEYALTDHTHSGYASTSHTHSNYALTDHTHSGYATTSHTHSGYAVTGHLHGSITSDGRLSNCSSADCFLRTSTNGFITHTDTDPRVSEVKELVAQWKEANKKFGKVISVCGKTGVVSLDASDVGAADADHTHGEYALTDHTHGEYALTDHTHSNYASTSHTHSGYAVTGHLHDDKYATLTAKAATSNTNITEGMNDVYTASEDPPKQTAWTCSSGGTGYVEYAIVAINASNSAKTQHRLFLARKTYSSDGRLIKVENSDKYIKV